MRAMALFFLALTVGCMRPKVHKFRSGDQLVFRKCPCDLCGINPVRTIAADGTITMPLIDTVRISGLTPAQAGARIETLLKEYILQRGYIVIENWPPKPRRK